ncbi:MAG: hypothetical protein Q9198_006161, partial [Flavoplaca austrocitrina]
MDPFKLLSRSSNLQKVNTSQSASVRHIPSAADSGNRETTSQVLDEVGEKSKKRKRQSGNDTYDGSQVQNSKYSKINSAGSNLDDRATESLKRTEHRPVEVSGVPIIQRTLGQDDCRRILKQNRLKVTVFEAGPSIEAWRKQRHKLLSRRPKASHRKEKAHNQLTTQPLQAFGDLRAKYNVSQRLARNLNVQGYRRPTEVQLGSLPLLLGNDRDRGLQLSSEKAADDSSSSDVDLLTIAPTGSGKTLAFLVHLLHGLRQDRQRSKVEELSEIRKKSVQALVLAPTHELVDQIVSEGKRLASGTGIKVSRMRKGMSIDSADTSRDAPPQEQVAKTSVNLVNDDEAPRGLSIKADILVSTPMLLLRAAASSSQDMATSLDQ